MQTLIKIHVSQHKVGKELFERLRAFCNEDESAICLTATFDPHDARLTAMLRILDEGGAAKVEDPFAELPDNGFRVETHFMFDDDDFRKASYFWFVAVPFVRAKRDDGVLHLDRNALAASVLIAATGVRQTHVISSSFRRALEAIDLVGIEFLATKVYAGVDAEKYAVLDWRDLPDHEPFWEVSSSIELPPVSPSIRLHSRRTEMLVERGFIDDGVRVVPNGDRGPAMSYLADEVLQCEPFDIAFTKERFGPSNHPDQRRQIVSRRFKEYCDIQRVKAKWFPVFVDE